MLTRAETRRYLGDMPERTLAQWVTKGIPMEGEGRAALFPWPEVLRWYEKQQRRIGREEGRPVSEDDARKRLESARAELAELELAEAQRLVVRVEEARQVIERGFWRVRAGLAAMPARHGATVVGLQTVAQGVAALDRAVREVMSELSDLKLQAGETAEVGDDA